MRVAQEIHDLRKLLFLLVRARNIGKGCRLFVLAGAVICFAEGHCAACAAVLAHHKEPEHRHCRNKQQGRQHGNPPWGFFYRNIVRLHCGGAFVLFLKDTVDVGKKYAYIRHGVFKLFFFALNLCGKRTRSEIEGIAFDFIVLEHFENLVILKLCDLFLIHIQKERGQKQKQNNSRNIGNDAQCFFVFQVINSEKNDFCSLFTPYRAGFSLFCINLRLYYADIGQIAVFLVIVKTIADDEFIRHDKAGVIRLYIDLAAFRLIKQCSYLY